MVGVATAAVATARATVVTVVEVAGVAPFIASQ